MVYMLGGAFGKLIKIQPEHPGRKTLKVLKLRLNSAVNCIFSHLKLSAKNDTFK